ncbi:DUF5908 family protein [Sphingomonas sp. IC-56]|uniref:DUF5908 family protein n=1 Tax=Sphingomonas sp. IC-56 TaxID=2898529 RepID=UPI001E6017C7|nr:DUF5908 family protein [Sphingomonas sp. IC-56]MCD2324182.1 DUF5908 family protein [Sphingomonas sp. IC-56]
MPLEIREIVIQMQVDDDRVDAPELPGSAMELLQAREDADAGEGQEALVEQCVAAVLAELDRRRGH